jgi:4-hydroxy 2-oxovalerate aldolase
MAHLYDVTLRDGNHALRHSLSPKFAARYAKMADESTAWAVEIGHGNGIGASSFLVGESSHSDEELLSAVRSNLSRAKLAVHVIPGFATVDRDVKPAISAGVDVFRLAAHVTEADVCEKHAEFLQREGQYFQGVLMMSHMAEIPTLVGQARLFEEYGAQAIVIMDSAGFFRPADVHQRITALVSEVGLDIGFHAHNNLGFGVSNALAAVEAGAQFIDGSSMGLGAGAGNAQLELIAANLGISETAPEAFESHLAMAHLVESEYFDYLPRVSPSSIQSGLAGVFSGYAPQVLELAGEFGVPPGDLWIEIGKRKLVAGQESMLREIAYDLMNL